MPAGHARRNFASRTLGRVQRADLEADLGHGGNPRASACRVANVEDASTYMG